jgi:pimeloyl-ACP methyl ester carboxylesterase
MERHQQASALATSKQWHETTLSTPLFNLKAFEPASYPPVDSLSVYIEGDGLAWLSATLPSPDPTPLHPLALQLALAQAEGRSAYLARPCQYQDSSQEQLAPCPQRYWTGSRFAPEVIDAMDAAVSQLKQRHGAKTLVLVGYSGGGSVAALLAMRRTDVIRLVTVAGNLDHRAWTEHHRLTPLTASLNPADEAIRTPSRLNNISQTHWVGGQDRVIPPALARQWPAALIGPDGSRLEIIPEATHGDGWLPLWQRQGMPQGRLPTPQ